MRILIVDDNREDLYMMEKLLSGNGYEVKTASDGIEALERLYADKFGMVISDILMPRMDGFQLCRRIKGDERLKHIAFIFYTATYTDSRDEEFALSLGAERFIIKPQEPDVFIGMLREVIRECEEGRLRAPRVPVEEEAVYLREYNERLIKKLEDKVLELGKKHRYEVIINTITQSIHRSINLQDILENAVSVMSENIEGVDQIGIYLVEGEEAVLKAHRGVTDQYIKKAGRIPYPKGATWKTIVGGRSYYIADVDKDETLGPAGREMGIKSYLSMPIQSEGKTVGCINISSFKRNAFNEEELKLLELVAERIETAMNNANQAEALRQSEERYRILFDQSPIGIYIFDRNLKIIQCNERMAEILQSSCERIIGFDIKELKDQGYVPSMERALEGKVSHHEGYYEATTGSARLWLSLHFYPLRNSNGNIIGGVAMVEDITKRKQIERALEESERHLRAIIDNEPECVKVLNKDGVILSMNPAGLAMIGVEKAEDVIGESVYQLIVPEHRERFRGLMERVSQGEKGCLQFEIVSLKGVRRWLETLHVPLRDDRGEVSGILGITRDITERKRAEDAIRESEERYRTLVENIYDLICETSMDGRFLYVNPKHKGILGYEPNELIGRSVFDYIHPDDRSTAVAEFRRAVLTFSSGGVTCRYRHRDGHWVWLECTGRPFRTAIGEIRGMIVSRDITERKRAEERMREQAELLDKARDAIAVRDLEDNLTYWNRSAERLYGWKADEVMGKNANDILYKKEDLPLLREAKRVLIEEGEWRGELEQVTKEGKKITVESRWTLIRDGEGRPRSILVVNTDVTEKKRLEAQFLRAQRMESIGTLAGGIAHDLNNVLQPITLSLQLLRGRLTDEQGRRWIDTLEASAERGASLIKQILSFARGMEGERTVIQLRYLISDIERMIRETFPRSIEIRADVGDGIWSIMGDVTQINQVLMNICVNARDAMPNGGTLSISAENVFIDEGYTRMNIEAGVGPYVVITVSDTGVGIPPGIRERIFEPFFTTKEVGKGTGLGLSTAFGIVKGHGGFINVYSEVGKGATFKVYLPAIETVEVKEARAKKTADLPRGDGELILVVDDEASVCETARATLEEYGYRVITAGDGAEAVAVYAERADEVSAIIMDMVMPVMDGWASIRAIRRINPGARVIAVSGLMEKERLNELKKMDVDAFLLKPYTSEAILRKLHEIIKRRGDS